MINAAPDGFNINVDCGSTHMERLQRHVVEQGLDVGFAYDAMPTAAWPWTSAGAWSMATRSCTCAACT